MNWGTVGVYFGTGDEGWVTGGEYWGTGGVNWGIFLNWGLSVGYWRLWAAVWGPGKAFLSPSSAVLGWTGKDTGFVWKGRKKTDERKEENGKKLSNVENGLREERKRIEGRKRMKGRKKTD